MQGKLKGISQSDRALSEPETEAPRLPRTAAERAAWIALQRASTRAAALPAEPQVKNDLADAYARWSSLRADPSATDSPASSTPPLVADDVQ